MNLPLLRKDFTVSENDVLDAADAGASAVLLIVAALSDDELGRSSPSRTPSASTRSSKCTTRRKRKRSLDSGARIIGVNQRNLHTFDVDRDNAARVIQSLPTSIVTVCESGLGSSDDVAHAAAAGFDAVLVGEAFVTRRRGRRRRSRLFVSCPLVSRA